MKIDAFLTPINKEQSFRDSVILMIDVLRASTTVCAALWNGAKEVIPCESLDEAVHIYGSLSRTTRFLGGERNGLKPDSFNAGNSPAEYHRDAVENKTVIISTTNGTKIFRKAKHSARRIVAGFVNFSAVCSYVKKLVESQKTAKIIIMCAGTDGRISYEDTLCAGAYIAAAEKFLADPVLTDSAQIAKSLYLLYEGIIIDIADNMQHVRHLKKLGFDDDIKLAFSFDAFPAVPVIEGKSARLAE